MRGPSITLHTIAGSQQSWGRQWQAYRTEAADTWWEQTEEAKCINIQQDLFQNHRRHTGR